MGAIWKAQKQQLGKDSQIVCFFACLLRFVWFLVMCKLSTCCLFLLIQFFDMSVFVEKSSTFMPNRNTPKAHRKTQAFAATLSHFWTGAQVWSMLFPGISSTALVRCGFCPASLLPCISWKKTSCKPEIQATISHLVDLFWSSISHQQSSSYMNYPKTIPTVSLPQGYDDVTRPCSVRWAGLGEGISHPAVKALIQSHLDRMAFVGENILGGSSHLVSG